MYYPEKRVVPLAATPGAVRERDFFLGGGGSSKALRTITRHT